MKKIIILTTLVIFLMGGCSVNPEKANIKSVPTTANIQNLSTIKLPILMYHHIRDVDDPKDHMGNYLTATSKQFKSQLDYIQQSGFTPVTFQ
ncbi:hypothetical protein HZC20_03980, partial [Candidatus Peregrinibacteria bacterium]|nr:hypothetical protein [Candidatus Peregrinibacteria bacterium]